MLHHVELYVSNLERSVSFWSPLMALLGYEEERWSYGMSYVRAPEAPYICLLEAEPRHAAAGYHRKRVGLNHLAFRAASIEQVDEVVTWLRRNGHNVLYEDRHPYAGGPKCYAVFFEDPDRIKLEVVVPLPGDR